MNPAMQDIFPVDKPFISPAIYDAFFVAIARLEATIVAETALLASNRLGELDRLTVQKRQGLLELSRLKGQITAAIPSQDIIARLATFRTVLEANERALSIHLTALKDVNSIIVRAMRDAESDGTYSRAYGRADYDLS